MELINYIYALTYITRPSLAFALILFRHNCLHGGRGPAQWTRVDTVTVIKLVSAVADLALPDC